MSGGAGGELGIHKALVLPPCSQVEEICSGACVIARDERVWVRGSKRLTTHFSAAPSLETHSDPFVGGTQPPGFLQRNSIFTGVPDH